MYKLLIINQSSLTDVQNYIDLHILPNLDIPVEVVDENDERLSLYAKHSNRFPIFVLFKNNVKLSVKYGKHSKADINNWIVSKFPLK